MARHIIARAHGYAAALNLRRASRACVRRPRSSGPSNCPGAHHHRELHCFHANAIAYSIAHCAGSWKKAWTSRRRRPLSSPRPRQSRAPRRAAQGAHTYMDISHEEVFTWWRWRRGRRRRRGRLSLRRRCRATKETPTEEEEEALWWGLWSLLELSPPFWGYNAPHIPTAINNKQLSRRRRRRRRRDGARRRRGDFFIILD